MPEAILLKDVDQLGTKGTVVDVSKGYLRNFLIPRELAAPATKGAIEASRRKAEADERARRDAADRAVEYAETLSRTVLTLSEKAGEDGRLFGSVTTQDIADAIREARSITVDRRHVHLDEPIKSIGTYQVTVEVAGAATASVKVIVTEAK